MVIGLSGDHRVVDGAEGVDRRRALAVLAEAFGPQLAVPERERVQRVDRHGDDLLVAAAIVVPDATLLVAGENGIGKRTPFDEYRVQSRGGKGIITMKTGDKTGAVVGALTVRESDEIMLITSGGQMVRTFVKDIREAGRNTMGVKLVNLDEGDKLQAIAPVISEDRDVGAANGEREGA